VYEERQVVQAPPAEEGKEQDAGDIIDGAEERKVEDIELAVIPPPNEVAPEVVADRRIPMFVNKCMKTPCDHRFHKNCL